MGSNPRIKFKKTQYKKTEDSMFQLILFIVILGLLLRAIVRVPPGHKGLLVRLDERVKGKTYEEGWHLIIPGLDKLLLYSTNIQSIDFTEKEAGRVRTKDDLDVLIPGTLQYKAGTNLYKYFEVEENALMSGLTTAIQSSLKNIIGKKESDVFKEQGEELELLINCVFRLSRAPHLYVDKKDDEDCFTIDRPSFNEYLDKLKKIKAPSMLKKEKLITSNWVMPEWKLDKKQFPEFDVLDFYQSNKSRIMLMLEFEAFMEEESSIEAEYAIEIISFKMANPVYTPETIKAMEEKKQTELELEAIKKTHILKKEIMDDLIAKGVPPSQASDDADAQLKIANKSVTPRNTLNLNNLK
jgi:hypothetical protein